MKTIKNFLIIILFTLVFNQGIAVEKVLNIWITGSSGFLGRKSSTHNLEKPRASTPWGNKSQVKTLHSDQYHRSLGRSLDC